MSEILGTERDNQIPINWLTANTIVSMMNELSLQGNPLINRMRSKIFKKSEEIEIAQNFGFLDAVSLQDFEVTLLTGRRLDSDGEIDDPHYAEIWVDNEDGEVIEHLNFRQDFIGDFYEDDKKATEARGLRIIRILENCHLLDSLTPDDIDDWPSHGAKLY